MIDIYESELRSWGMRELRSWGNKLVSDYPVHPNVKRGGKMILDCADEIDRLTSELARYKAVAEAAKSWTSKPEKAETIARILRRMFESGDLDPRYWGSHAGLFSNLLMYEDSPLLLEEATAELPEPSPNTVAAMRDEHDRLTSEIDRYRKALEDIRAYAKDGCVLLCLNRTEDILAALKEPKA